MGDGREREGKGITRSGGPGGRKELTADQQTSIYIRRDIIGFFVFIFMIIEKGKE